MDVQHVILAFNNLLRLRICLLLEGKSLSINQIKESYEKKYNEKKNRETIYRALEILVKNGIVDKIYNKQNKKILYSMIINKVVIDFKSDKISVEKND